MVRFFDRGGDHFGFEGKSELEPLDLTSEEEDLVAFLHALAGPGPDPKLFGPQ